MELKRMIAEIKEILAAHHGLWLAHNYQRAEIQDAADLTGDSLGLSLAAAKTEAEWILFCGVHFMAESAAILCPDKQVILPRPDAGCPMANMITAEQLRVKKRELGENTTIVTYVNSTAAVKAESDVCCTSANAARVADFVDTDEIFFVPDQNLAQYVAAHTGKRVTWWNGYCHVHHHIQAEHVLRVKSLYPEAVIVVHPESRPEVTALADEVASTSGMLKWIKRTTVKQAIIGTEIGMLHPLRKANPRVELIPLAPELQICGNMKLTTIEDVYHAVQNPQEYTIRVEDEVQQRAKTALDRMLAIPAE